MIKNYIQKIVLASLFGFLVTSIFFSSTVFSAYDDVYYFEQLSASRYPRVANDITGTLIASQFHLPILAGVVSPTPVIKFNFNTSGIYFKVSGGTDLPPGLSMDSRGMISGSIDPNLSGTTHTFLLEMRSLDQATLYAAGFVLIDIKDACIPTIRHPAFDSAYITSTQTNRRFTPSLPVTPFDNFYIDFEFKASCPATRIVSMLPSLKSGTFSMSANGGSLVGVGNRLYRWSFLGYPNGIVSSVSMNSLLYQLGLQRPVTVELLDSATGDVLATKDFAMGSCVRVSGDGQIPVVVIGSERIGELPTASEGANLLDKATIFGTRLFTTDPFKKYKNRFALYADLKPISFDNDWERIQISTPVTLNSQYQIAKNLSSCGFDASTYIVVGDKLLKKESGNSDYYQSTGRARKAAAMLSSKGFNEVSALHEFLHSFADLNDEYVYNNPEYQKYTNYYTKANCTRNPSVQYSYGEKKYGATDQFGCAYSIEVNRPSLRSIMGALSNKLNKVSCAFVVAKIQGGDPKSYYPECAGLDVEDPGEDVPKKPIEVLTQTATETWAIGQSGYEIRWKLPEVKESTVEYVTIVLQRLGGDAVSSGSIVSLSEKVDANKGIFTTSYIGAPVGQYRLVVFPYLGDRFVSQGVGQATVLIIEALSPPIVTPPPANQSVTPGSSTTINGSGFTPTGNKVQLIKTGPVSFAPQGFFQTFASLFAKGINSIASVIGASVTPTSTTADPVTTYEIKDIPSNGTSLTFTIPANIPPGIYTMKVAGLNSNYSQGITITIASPIPAPVITSLNHTSSIVGSWIIAQGSGFSTSTITNTDKVQFSNGIQTVEGVAGISASSTGDIYVDSSLPNLTFGNYSAFRVPTSLTPGVYSLRIARQNGVWSNPLSYTVLPAQNSDGTYNFAYAIASKKPSDTEVVSSMPSVLPIQQSSLIAGAQTTLMGSNFSPTGNRVQLTTPNQQDTRNRIRSESSFLDKTKSNLASLIDSVITTAPTATTDSLLTYEIKDIPSTTGTSITFTIPQGIPSAVYTLKVASLTSDWSPGISVRIISRGPANETINPVTPPTQDRASLIAQLLALIEQLTAQLEAIKAGKTEISNTSPVVTTPTTPNILPFTPATVCTQEVNQCSDGSFVGRIPPSCAFQACPTTAFPPPTTFACPADTSPCANGTSVSRIPPLCLFAACPNTFTPPPPVVVTPPPTVVIPPVVVIPPPPPTITTLPPVSSPVEPTLSASLSPVYEDRVGPWGSFAPAAGSIYGSSKGDIHDFVWNATLTLSGSKTIRAINLTHNTGGEYWSTDNANAYPLVIFKGGAQLNTAYSQTLGTYGAGGTDFVIYGQFETPTFSGGTLTFTFTDNTSVTATIPASSFSPCTTCTSQAGAVFEAVGNLMSEWWREVLGTFTR